MLALQKYRVRDSTALINFACGSTVTSLNLRGFFRPWDVLCRYGFEGLKSNRVKVELGEIFCSD